MKGELNNVTKIDEGFVVSRYRQANNRPEQIDILAQLYETDIDTIIEILEKWDALDLRDLSRFHRCKVCGAFIKANARQGKCLECRSAENRAIRRARIIANRGGGRGHKKGES